MKQKKPEKERENYVVKANDLIQKSRFSLSLQQQKVVLYLISKITPSDEDFRLYEFKTSDFCRVCGINPKHGKNHDDLKEAIKAIADKSVWVTLDDGRETLVRWIEKPYFDPEKNVIQIRLDKDMKPFLLHLKNNFTQYELLWTLNFKSKYTIRLYELVKSIHYFELEVYTRVYGLDEIKTLLGAENYDSWQTFKNRVLEPSTREINSASDKMVTYEPIKTGRAVTGVLLKVYTKNAAERARIRAEVEQKFELNQLSLWGESR